MTSKHSIFTLAFYSALSAMLISGAFTASAGEIGVGVTAGTDGVGAHVKTALSSKITVSGGYNYLEFGRDEAYDGIDYQGDLKLSNFSGFVNLHPFGNGFNISGGAYVGSKYLDLVATPTQSVNVGDVLFTPAQIGTLVGRANLKDFAPYAGIGYDSFANAQGNWSFNAKLGVMFTGSPEVDMNSVGGTLSNNPAFNTELAKEITALEQDIEDFKYYPTVSLGITRKF